MATLTQAAIMQPRPDYWSAVTDVRCPDCVTGIVRWAENGHVPGYRICDGCGQHWMAEGTVARPVLAPLTEVGPSSFAGAPEGKLVRAGQPYRFRGVP